MIACKGSKSDWGSFHLPSPIVKAVGGNFSGMRRHFFPGSCFPPPTAPSTFIPSTTSAPFCFYSFALQPRVAAHKSPREKPGFPAIWFSYAAVPRTPFRFISGGQVGGHYGHSWATLGISGVRSMCILHCQTVPGIPFRTYWRSCGLKLSDLSRQWH